MEAADVTTIEEGQEIQDTNEEQAAPNSQGLVESKATKKVEGEDKTSTVHLDLGTNLEEMRSRFGDQVVYDRAVRSLKIQAQAQQRSMLEDGKSDEEIQAAFRNWNPEAKPTRAPRDPKQDILRNFAALSEEEKAAIIAQLQG